MKSIIIFILFISSCGVSSYSERTTTITEIKTYNVIKVYDEETKSYYCAKHIGTKTYQRCNVNECMCD